MEDELRKKIPDQLIGKKDLIAIGNPLQNHYLSVLKTCLDKAKESSVFPGIKDIKLPNILSFLAYSDKGGILESIVVDRDSGLPDQSEISRVINSYDPDIFPFIKDDEKYKEKIQELAQLCTDNLAEGKLPKSHQAYFRRTHYYRDIMMAKKNERFPKYRVINQSKNDEGINVNLIDYSVIENIHQIWDIKLNNGAIEKNNALQKTRRGFSKMLSRITTDTPRNGKPYHIDEEGNLVRDKEFDSIIMGSTYFNSNLVKAAIEAKYPDTVESVTRTSIGPFFFPTIQNYSLFEDACPGLIPYEDLEKRFEKNICFLAIRQDSTNGKGPSSKISFTSINEDLENYLNDLNFPNFYYVRVPFFIPGQTEAK